jgi:MSHA type pilus biogenesis protein MshL
MLGRQIHIEARIIEVVLSDEYQYGINWEALRNLGDGATLLNTASWSMGNGLLLSGQSGEWSLGSAVNALNTFGDTKVVSNPSIRSKHGKPAMISVGTSFTYKKSVETTTTSTATDSDTTTEVEVSTVFDGLILGVVPFIEDNGRITLLINPIKSDVNRESLVPEAVGDGQSISLPEVRIKEISTTIDLHDGDVVILGGLIDKQAVTDDNGIPFFSAIPVLGYLFKNELNREETRELVIILSVNLV